MPQHDMEIANADANTGLTMRAAINAALQALVSNNAGATEPNPSWAYMWWPDTTTGLLKIRNAANDGWITVGTLASAYLGLAALAVANEFTATQKIKGDALGLRIYDTGGSGKEWLIRSDGGNIEICENTGTEGSPTWTVRVTINASGVSLAANSTKWDGAAKTVSTSDPSGGSDGDIWFKYTA